MTRKSKSLHSLTIDGITISTNIRYDLNTNHIGIRSSFINSKLKPLNKNCSQYLGITCAEQVLSKVFKNVTRMPNNNRGYDFICGKGYKVDVKSSCKDKIYGSWGFHIKQNKIPNYFALLAFDNRDDINPLHFWLIPSNLINDKVNFKISKLSLSKWDKYKQDINKVITCCYILKRND
jgi:hypothetical protein